MLFPSNQVIFYVAVICSKCIICIDIIRLANMITDIMPLVVWYCPHVDSARGLTQVVLYRCPYLGQVYLWYHGYISQWLYGNWQMAHGS